MSTFASLKADIQSWSLRSDYPESIYKLATALINRSLLVREMLSDFSATTSGESVTLPSDFIEFDHVYIDADPRVVLMAADQWQQSAFHRSSGQPATYSIKDGVILLNPVPDGSYSLAGRYYAELADFSADSDTNDVLTKFPEIYLFANLMFVYAWLQDAEREVAATNNFMAVVDAANKKDVKARFTGPVRQRARASA